MELEKIIKLIVDNSIQTVISALLIIALGIKLNQYRKSINSEYVKIIDINKDWLHKNKPEICLYSSEGLPNLLAHPAFIELQKVIDTADAIVIYGNDDLPNKLKTDITIDLIKCCMRSKREQFKSLINDIYGHKDGFEKYFEDHQDFNQTLNKHIAICRKCTNRHLLETKIPQFLINRYNKEIGYPSDELYSNMIELASMNSGSYYFKVSQILNSIFADAITIKNRSISFMIRVNGELDGYKYIRDTSENRSTFDSRGV